MQWIFMIIGAIIGAQISFESSLLGACIGFFIGYAIKIQTVISENQKLREELETINQRLTKTEEFIKLQVANASIPTIAVDPNFTVQQTAPHKEKQVETKRDFNYAPTKFFIRQINIIELTEKQKRQPKIIVNAYHLAANKPEQTVTLATQTPAELPPTVLTIEEPKKAPRCLVFAPANHLISQATITKLTNKSLYKPQPFDSTPAIVVSNETQTPLVETIKLEVEQPIESVNYTPQPQPAFVRAAARVAKAPAVSYQENIISKLFSAARNWLFGGNIILRMGAVILFLGLAFLLRYATEGMVFPVEGRYIGVAIAGLVLIGLGWRLRHREGNYGLILQGTGIGILYLTSYAAMYLHGILPAKFVFVLLVIITISSATLAIMQNAISLAVPAALGAFAAPILASTGGGSHVALFSYYVLVNMGILSIAWFKAWRPLNIVGFTGTFGIGFVWGMQAYTPALFWSTEPFLIIFFIMYVAIGLLFARRKLLEAEEAPEEENNLIRWAVRQTDYIDASIMIGTPVVCFGLQYSLVEHIANGAAISALILGIFYLFQAYLFHTRGSQRVSLLTEVCLALGVVFATLSIPLALSARWTSASWALEAAGIYWISLKQQRKQGQFFAILLQFGAALAFLSEVSLGTNTVLSASPFGAFMIGISLLFSFYHLNQHIINNSITNNHNQLLSNIFSITGLGFLYSIALFYFQHEGVTICWAIAGAVTLIVGTKLNYPMFTRCAFIIQTLASLIFIFNINPSLLGVGVEQWSSLLSAKPLGALILGISLLFSFYTLNQRLSKQQSEDYNIHLLANIFSIVGLGFLYLIALFCFSFNGVVIYWAIGGAITLIVGSKLNYLTFINCAFVIQVLAALLFIFHINPEQFGVGITSWQSLFATQPMSALVLGASLLFSFYFLNQAINKETFEDGYTQLLANIFSIAGLGFLYSMALFYFPYSNVVICWAIAGAITIKLGLKLKYPTFIGCSFIIQGLAGLLFIALINPNQLAIGIEHWQSLFSIRPVGAFTLGITLLFSFYCLNRSTPKQDILGASTQLLANIFSIAGLGFLYTMALFYFTANGIVICWAIAGIFTLRIGSRWNYPTFIGCAFIIQLLAGLLFTSNIIPSQLGSEVQYWSSFGTALFVGLLLTINALLNSRNKQESMHGILFICERLVLLLGLFFICLSFLFIYSWQTVTGIWAISAIIILILAQQFNIRTLFVCSLLLQIIAGAGLVAYFNYNYTSIPLLHSSFWSPLCIAIAGLFSAWQINQLKITYLNENAARQLSLLALAWGVLWWLFAFTSEITELGLPVTTQATWLLCSLAASMLLATLVAKRYQWLALAHVTCLLLPLAAVIFINSPKPFVDFGWLAWAAIFTVHLFSLKHLEQLLIKVCVSICHILGVWLLLLVITFELRHLLTLTYQSASNAWFWIFWVVAPCAWLLFISLKKQFPWPINSYFRTYCALASMPVAIFTFVWFWQANIFAKGITSFNYIPLINPLETSLLIALLSSMLWGNKYLTLLNPTLDKTMVDRLIKIAIGTSLFALSMGIVCRTAYHWLNVPFIFAEQMKSMPVQASLSIVWTFTALGLMTMGHKKGFRELWLVGAGLITLVVVKLFFVELSNSGSLARIISFTVVGVLLLIVGYFAPLPPKQKNRQEK